MRFSEFLTIDTIREIYFFSLSNVDFKFYFSIDFNEFIDKKVNIILKNFFSLGLIIIAFSPKF